MSLNLRQGETILLLVSMLSTELLLKAKGDWLRANHSLLGRYVCWSQGTVFRHSIFYTLRALVWARDENSWPGKQLCSSLSKTPITPCKGLSSLSPSGLVSCQTWKPNRNKCCLIAPLTNVLSDHCPDSSKRPGPTTCKYPLSTSAGGGLLKYWANPSSFCQLNQREANVLEVEEKLNEYASIQLKHICKVLCREPGRQEALNKPSLLLP